MGFAPGAAATPTDLAVGADIGIALVAEAEGSERAGDAHVEVMVAPVRPREWFDDLADAVCPGPSEFCGRPGPQPEQPVAPRRLINAIAILLSAVVLGSRSLGAAGAPVPRTLGLPQRKGPLSNMRVSARKEKNGQGARIHRRCSCQC